MRALDIAVLAGLGYLGWRLYSDGGKGLEAAASSAADAADRVLRTVGVRTPNAIGTDALKSGSFRVINGLVYHFVTDAKTGAATFRIATPGGTFVNRPANYPAIRESDASTAPVVLPGYGKLLAAGEPWYAPWTSNGKGLSLPAALPRA